MQFVTSSLRRPESPQPMDRRQGESPFVTLRWKGLTEQTAGGITYEVHAAADSATAADPTMPRVRWRRYASAGAQVGESVWLATSDWTKGYFGYIFRSDHHCSFRSPIDPDPNLRARMWMFYARSTPAPTAASLAGRPGHR